MNRYLSLILLFILLVACRPTTFPSPTPITAQPTESRPEPTLTNISPTSTPIPPTPTTISATDTPPSATATQTPIPPTETSTPTLVPTPVNITLGPFQAVAGLPAGTDDDNWRLYQSADGQLWFVGDSQIERFVDNGWQFYTTYAGEFKGIDSSGRVWVFRKNGLISSIDGAANQVIYNQDSGWPVVDWAEEMVLDSSGRVWFLTSDDIRHLEGEQWIITTFAEAGLAVVEDESYEPTYRLISNGTIWLSHCNWAGPGPAGGVGVRWFDGTTWQGADSPIAECISEMVSLAPDDVWFGGEQAVWHYQAGTWQQVSFPAAPAGSNGLGFVYHLVIDSTNTPWPTLSLCGGASCFAGEILYSLEGFNWQPVEGWPDVVPIEPLAIGSDPQGNQWLFSNRGLFQWQNNELVLWPDLTQIRVPAGNPTFQWFAAEYEGQLLLWKMIE